VNANNLMLVLNEIIEDAPKTYVTKGRKSWQLSAPACPIGPAVAYVRGKLDALIAAAKAEENRF